MITYRVLQGKGVDDMEDPFWIERTTTKRFLFWRYKRRKVLGDYKMDDTYGELGYCPFFSREKAEQRIKKLTK